jgi:hypothetical protein
VFLEIKNRIMHLRLHYFQSNCPDFPPQIGARGCHKTAKPALEILAEWRFLDPTGSQKGGCRMTRLADFELNFEGKIRKKPDGIHRA